MKFRNLKKRGFALTREKLGLSQRQLAEQLGISHSTIAMAETGRRQLPTAALLKIADLGIKMAAAMETIKTTGQNKMDLLQDFKETGNSQYEPAIQYLMTQLENQEAHYKTLHTRLLLLDAMLEKERGEPGNLSSYLTIQRRRILKKLSSCGIGVRGMKNFIAKRKMVH